jgi:hypothetical protein
MFHKLGYKINLIKTYQLTFGNIENSLLVTGFHNTHHLDSSKCLHSVQAKLIIVSFSQKYLSAPAQPTSWRIIPRDAYLVHSEILIISGGHLQPDDKTSYGDKGQLNMVIHNV